MIEHYDVWPKAVFEIVSVFDLLWLKRVKYLSFKVACFANSLNDLKLFKVRLFGFG
jgi:hypothetical protein